MLWLKVKVFQKNAKNISTILTYFNEWVPISLTFSRRFGHFHFNSSLDEKRMDGGLLARSDLTISNLLT